MKQPLAFFETIGEAIVGKHDPNQFIEKVFTNSKEHVNNALFIPIKGERFDGHDFIHEAVENGAVATFWQKDKPLPEALLEKVTFILVQDTLTALQQTAEKFLKLVRPTVVAITGSNGKTTTKDLVSSIVSTTFQTHKTQGNYNNHIGMPLTILAMDEDCEVLILEMGMNDFGEISFLSKLAKPNFAIITNIGDSHLEKLITRENIAKAKLEIVDGLESGGTLIVDGDEPLLNRAFDRKQVISCGFNSNCTVQIHLLSSDEHAQTFQIENEETLFTLSMLGKHNVKNASYAIVLAKQLGISDENIQAGLNRVDLTGMRLERQTGKHGALLINDAYNASPTSMIAALQSLLLLKNYPKKIAVLGDMYELGKEEERLHKKVAEHINDDIDAVFCVGKKGKWIGEALFEKNFQGKVFIFEEINTDLIESLERFLSEETVVLFKASRGMKLERVIEHFVDGSK